MQVWERLGCVAHRGGVVVTDAVLSVGVVQAVARVGGLQLELVARRPLDDRSALQRQADIIAGVVIPEAPRVLLPTQDEGVGLRVGWFGSTGRARWAHPVATVGSSGDPAGGRDGPTMQATYVLPPLFGGVELVLAWPEIGFAEQVVSVLLPDRAAAVRSSVSVWEAPTRPGRAPSWSRVLPVEIGRVRCRQEEGVVLVDPQVLWRSADAVVVLTRLSSYGQVWQVELVGYARNSRADIAMAVTWGARGSFAGGGTGGLRVGVVNGDTVHWNPLPSGQTSGGPGTYATSPLATLPAPSTLPGADVRLAVRWPAVGLPETEFVLHHLDLLPAAPG